MALLLALSLLSAVWAADPACTKIQYQRITGFPASQSACYPLNYYQTFDLGNTNPDDARTRCRQSCTSAGDSCKSIAVQVNKAADSNLYSGTCYLFAPGQTVSPRRCANTAYLVDAESKNTVNTCVAAGPNACTNLQSQNCVGPNGTKNPPGSVCGCYTTTEGDGICKFNGGFFKVSCNRSSDCPGGRGCLKSTGICTPAAGFTGCCAEPEDLPQCQTSSSKMFVRARDQPKRYPISPLHG